MQNNKFKMEPTIYACLAKMYSKCNEPEQVASLWGSIEQSRVRLDSTLYTSLLTACADWAKKVSAPSEASGTDVEINTGTMLKLGKQIHEHILRSMIRCLFSYFFLFVTILIYTLELILFYGTQLQICTSGVVSHKRL
jgi:hypothetical protein